MFPSLPPPDGLHPLVVHFPIALLLIAPLFVLLAAFEKRRGGLAVAAAVMIALGTAFVFYAVLTGEAAEDQAEAVVSAKATFERHEELAELSRPVFAGLTVVYLGMLGTGLWMKEKLKRGVWMGLSAGFLVLYAGGALLLANVAHEGGRLVHEFGVRAPIAGGGGLPAGIPELLERLEDND